MKYLKHYKVFENLNSTIKEIEMMFEDTMFNLDIQDSDSKKEIIFVDFDGTNLFKSIGLIECLPLPYHGKVNLEQLDKLSKSEPYKQYMEECNKSLERVLFKLKHLENNGLILINRRSGIDYTPESLVYCMNSVSLTACIIHVYKNPKIQETSLAHGLSGGSGAPAFGLGGVNYGYDNIPNTISKQDTSFLYSEITGKYYSNDEIKELFSNYIMKCREEHCQPIITQIQDLTSSILDEIINTLQ